MSSVMRYGVGADKEHNDVLEYTTSLSVFAARCSGYWLYWYKSTNTDAEWLSRPASSRHTVWNEQHTFVTRTDNDILEVAYAYSIALYLHYLLL
jgi:hypothetical protein